MKRATPPATPPTEPPKDVRTKLVRRYRQARQWLSENTPDWLLPWMQQLQSALKRVPIGAYSFYRAVVNADYARTLTDLYVAQATSLPEALTDRSSVTQVSEPARQPVVPEPARIAPQQAAAQLQEAGADSALMLLGLLQKEGRLIDFLRENVTAYSDQDVGNAARVVHQGCQRVLRDYMQIEPIREEPEGSRVTLPRGFDPTEVRPVGNVVGEPPFSGALVHRGWRVVEVRLPKVTDSRDLRLLAVAEVEL